MYINFIHSTQNNDSGIWITSYRKARAKYKVLCNSNEEQSHQNGSVSANDKVPLEEMSKNEWECFLRTEDQ